VRSRWREPLLTVEPLSPVEGETLFAKIIEAVRQGVECGAAALPA